MLEPLSLPFVQRGMLEVAALALAAGLLGTWVVLRGLAFYAHAVGTAAFPGLVLADGLGFSALLGAFATAIVVAALVAVAAVAALRIAGALLATALIVVPAATTRLVCDRLPAWQAATVALVLA